MNSIEEKIDALLEHVILLRKAVVKVSLQCEILEKKNTELSTALSIMAANYNPIFGIESTKDDSIDQ